MAMEPEIRTLAPEPTAVIRFTCPPGQVPPNLGAAYGEIGSYLHDSGIEHDDAGVYARFLEFDAEYTVEAGFTVATPIAGRGRVQPGELPGGPAAVGLHVGPYSGIAAATVALREWVAAEGRSPGGPSWELYLDDPENTAEADLRTEIYIPLA